MEKAKPSKKKAYYKNRHQDSQRGNSAEPNLKSKGSNANLRLRGSNEYRFDPNDSVYDGANFAKRSLQQPESRLADLDEIWQETNVGQDFETLVNAPLSADSHFVFKSEKNWTLETSIYDDYFTLNVKDLATAINCVPFNRYVRVEDKYFTKDELTDINNTADNGKKAYDLMIETAGEKRQKAVEKIEETSSRSKPKVGSSDSEDSLDYEDQETCQGSEEIEEDLEFLLSLKEPVRPNPIAGAPPIKSAFEESKAKTVPVATKSIDLEKWLDLVLDD